MSVHNFYKTQLIYKVLNAIRCERDLLVRDLVAYTTDPVRYKRRIRILINLADYEKQVLEKIRDFETDQSKDLDLISTFESEIKSLVNVYA